MRAWEFIIEDTTPNSFADNLKLKADMKSEQAKKMKQTAALAKKRDQINSTRAALSKKQGELAKLTSSAP